MRDTIFLSLARKVVYISSIAVFGTIASIVMYATFAAFTGPSSGPSAANHSRGLLYDYMFGAATTTGAVQQGSAWNFVPASVTAALSGTINEKLNYMLQNGGAGSSGGSSFVLTLGSSGVTAGGTAQQGTYFTQGGNPNFCSQITVDSNGKIGNVFTNEWLSCDTGKICRSGLCTNWSNGITYSWKMETTCDTNDIVLPNGQVWAACNVWATQAGTGSSAAEVGKLFAWGNNTPYTGTPLIVTGSTYWGVNDQGPCASGYHVPSLLDIRKTFNYFADITKGTDTNTYTGTMVPLWILATQMRDGLRVPSTKMRVYDDTMGSFSWSKDLPLYLYKNTDLFSAHGFHTSYVWVTYTAYYSYSGYTVAGVPSWDKYTFVSTVGLPLVWFWDQNYDAPRTFNQKVVDYQTDYDSAVNTTLIIDDGDTSYTLAWGSQDVCMLPVGNISSNLDYSLKSKPVCNNKRVARDNVGPNGFASVIYGWGVVTGLDKLTKTGYYVCSPTAWSNIYQAEPCKNIRSVSAFLDFSAATYNVGSLNPSIPNYSFTPYKYLPVRCVRD